MRIAIIGAGRVGTTLGRAWAEAGHAIVYGVREGTGDAPHAGARVESVRDAAKAGEVVVLVVPWAAAADALSAAGDLENKPLVDATNPIGPGLTLTHGHTTSGAEQVAALASHARVVKAFNTTGFENMANPRFGGRRIVMPVAGDDAEAVAMVAGLASQIGFDAIALRGLVRARELEPLGALWIKLALQWGHGRSIGFALSRRTAGDAPPASPPARVPRRIAIAGSGNVGGALAAAWQRAGHDVRMTTRGAGADEVTDREVVVFAIPAGAVVDAARTMGGLAGKIVVDCTNAIEKGLALRYGHFTSSAEELARALPGARIVRSFNQQGAEVLRNPMFGGVAATNFVAADDDEARRIVVDLAKAVGLDAVEAGPLASSRYLEPMTPLWIAMAQSLGTREIGLSLLRR